MTNSFAGMSMDAPPAAPSHHNASAPDPSRPPRKNEPPARPPPPTNVPTAAPQAPQGAPNPYAGAPGPLPYPTQPGAMPMPYAPYTPMPGNISINPSRCLLILQIFPIESWLFEGLDCKVFLCNSKSLLKAYFYHLSPFFNACGRRRHGPPPF